MKQLKASSIAEFLGASLHGEDIDIGCAATLDSAKPGAVIFLKKAEDALIQKIAAHKNVLAIVPPGVTIPDITTLAVEAPRLAFARVLKEFFAKPKPQQRIAATAVIDATAELAEDVYVGEYSVIGPGAKIGPRTVIRHHVTIAAGVTIGADCLIKSSSVIGEEGFGFEKDEKGVHTRIPHIGTVAIGDRVEVGALTSICCGTVDNTVIGDDTKIDDHVFIAHNVKTGNNCIIIAASEVSGSVTLGDGAWLAPGVTIINGVSVGAGALLGTGAVITKPVEPKAIMGGARATFIRYTDDVGK